MFKKGTMLPAKKIMGGGLLAIGFGVFFMPTYTKEILFNNEMVLGTLLISAGYFLFIAGRQNGK